MKYKALILDLDGTVILQGGNEPPSIRVTNAIAVAKDRIHITVASGRPLHVASHIIDHLSLSGPCVLHNGAQIYDPVKKIMISSYPLGQQVLPEIFSVFKKYSYTILISDGWNDVVYDRSIIPDVVMSAWMDEVDRSDVDAIIENLQKISGVSVHKMPAKSKEGCFSVEVTNAQATKLHGIIEIMKLLHINKEEVIGVGDSYNDFPLLMASGLKIAMGNAIPELKAIADFIAPSVDEDGVATIIEKFILES